MAGSRKTLERVLKVAAEANIAFDDLCALLRSLGFTERTRGSHHLFVRPGIEDLINLQRDGSKAKRYQVRQVRSVILKYNLNRND